MARVALSEGSTGAVGALKQIMEASRGGDLCAQEKIVSRLRTGPLVRGRHGGRSHVGWDLGAVG